MQSRRERPAFNERNWNCVSVQSPLGAVLLARKLPSAAARPSRPSGTLSNWINRRFALSNQRDSATKRIRWRR